MNEPRSVRGDRWPAHLVPAVDRRVRAPGFTLMELLIVIGLLGVLTGVVFASLRPLRDAARTQSGMDRVGAFVRDLRGLALTSGEPVTVVLDPATGRMHGQWLTGPPGARRSGGVADGSDVDLGGLMAAEPASSGSRGSASASASAAGGDFDDEDRRVQEPWASFVLDPRLTLSTIRPEGDESAAMDALAAARGLPEGAMARPDFADPIGMFDESEPVRLVVFMPDGTTLLARSAWLEGVDGDVWRLDVHPWTGDPFWTEEAFVAEDDEAGMFAAPAPAPAGAGP